MNSRLPIDLQMQRLLTKNVASNSRNILTNFNIGGHTGKLIKVTKGIY